MFFLYLYSKYCWISDTEYDPSGDSKSSFKVGADIVNLLLLYDFFVFFYVQ